MFRILCGEVNNHQFTLQEMKRKDFLWPSAYVNSKEDAEKQGWVWVPEKDKKIYRYGRWICPKCAKTKFRKEG